MTGARPRTNRVRRCLSGGATLYDGRGRARFALPIGADPGRSRAAWTLFFGIFGPYREGGDPPDTSRSGL
nr:hypothetical protein [Gammaproteobacteria bacterium]